MRVHFHTFSVLRQSFRICNICHIVVGGDRNRTRGGRRKMMRVFFGKELEIIIFLRDKFALVIFALYLGHYSNIFLISCQLNLHKMK